jgi:hypothetical protein
MVTKKKKKVCNNFLFFCLLGDPVLLQPHQHDLQGMQCGLISVWILQLLPGVHSSGVLEH